MCILTDFASTGHKWLKKVTINNNAEQWLLVTIKSYKKLE